MRIIKVCVRMCMRAQKLLVFPHCWCLLQVALAEDKLDYQRSLRYGCLLCNCTAWRHHRRRTCKQKQIRLAAFYREAPSGVFLQACVLAAPRGSARSCVFCQRWRRLPGAEPWIVATPSRLRCCDLMFQLF